MTTPSDKNNMRKDEEELKALNEESTTISVVEEEAASPSTDSFPPTTLVSKTIKYVKTKPYVIIGTITLIGFIFVVLSDVIHNSNVSSMIGTTLRMANNHHSSQRWGGAVHSGYFTIESSLDKEVSNEERNVYKFAAVTDLDQLTDMHESKLTFKSFLLPGTITHDLTSNKYSINFDPKRLLTSKHNQGGRGMELSELTLYENRLLSFDDKTGDVFEILNTNRGQDSFVVPRFIITEGDGDTDKGMKWEWSTVKDGELYLGSWGKDYLNDDGSIAHYNNLWIAIIDRYGTIRRVNWYEQYNVVKNVLGVQAQNGGYVINEAVLWSDYLRSWVITPRRVSISTPYNDEDTERKGSNKLVLCNENFTECNVKDIQISNLDPLHGFSSLAFVPNTNDEHVIAIRSVEEDCSGDDMSQCKQRSYFMIFNILTGEVLLDEVQYEENLKFEGIEFVDAYTPEPTY